MKRFEDLVLDIDGCFGGEGVDEREIYERSVVEHLAPLSSGNGL